MERLPAQNRKPAFNRKPAGERKRIGFIPDGKIHVVLDTNIPMNAMWALQKGQGATQEEKACLIILRTIEQGKIQIGLDSNVWKEYEKKVQEHTNGKNDKLKPENAVKILKIMEPNQSAFRKLVDPQEYSPDKEDDIFFNGLSADYLISENLKHVLPAKLKGGKSPYKETLNAINFVTKVLKIKIL